MIKKARITEMYQVNLYCDKCGARMKRSKDFVLMSNPPKFKYECECGHSETSMFTYPAQQVVFDEKNAVIVDESDLYYD